jgi:hypothetical protein
VLAAVVPEVTAGFLSEATSPSSAGLPSTFSGRLTACNPSGLPVRLWMPAPPVETRLARRMTGGSSPLPPSGRAPNVDDYVEVWWAGDRVFYRGTVISYNIETNEHCVLYDDGESGSYDMSKESWRRLRSASADASTRRTPNVGDNPTGSADDGKELSRVHEDNDRASPEPERPRLTDPQDSALEVADEVEPVISDESKKDGDGRVAAAREHVDLDRNIPELQAPVSPRSPERAQQVLDTRPKEPGCPHETSGVNALGFISLSDTKRGQRGRGGRKSLTRGKRAKSGTAGREGLISADAHGSFSIGNADNDSRATARPSLDGPDADDPSHGPEDEVGATPPDKDLPERREAGEDSMGQRPQRDAQTPDIPGSPAREPFLPLDHVMTAVVQTTVMMLDERLKPIGDRIDDLSALMRQSNPQAMSDVVRELHAKHLQDMDETRREIKRLRTEHRAVISETFAVKEAELRGHLELSLNRAVNEFSSYFHSALASASGVAATAAFAATAQPGPGLTSPTADALQAPLMGPSNTDPSRPGQSAVQGKRELKLPASHGAPENPSSNAQAGSQARNPESQRLSLDAQMLPQFPGSKRNADNFDDSILLVKQRALEIAARQVTVWLLETQHECFQPSERARWVSETTKRCAADVADKLSRYDTSEQAIQSLTSTLGDDNIELGWMLQSPTLENLRRARLNYVAWQPPPNDSEWMLEQNLLRMLSEQFNWAIAKQQITHEQNEVAMAVEAARIIVESTSADPSTAHRRASRSQMNPANGSAVRSSFTFEVQGNGQGIRTAGAAGGQQQLGGRRRPGEIAGPSQSRVGIPSLPKEYAMGGTLHGPRAEYTPRPTSQVQDPDTRYYGGVR